MRNFKFLDNVNSFFEWHEMIGCGNHGSVYTATHKKWDTLVAVKIINKERLVS